MKIEHACVTVQCDTCREDYEDGDGNTMHYPTILEAEQDAENGDWITVGDKHFCEGDRPACSTCGHSWKGHNYDGGACTEDGNDEQKCACQEFAVISEPERTERCDG